MSSLPRKSPDMPLEGPLVVTPTGDFYNKHLPGPNNDGLLITDDILEIQTVGVPMSSSELSDEELFPSKMDPMESNRKQPSLDSGVQDVVPLSPVSQGSGASDMEWLLCELDGKDLQENDKVESELS